MRANKPRRLNGSAHPPLKENASPPAESLEELSGLTLPDAADVFSLLGDKLRLQIVLVLARGGEHNASTLQEACGLSRQATSHHLRLLRMRRLVDYRRDGRHNCYFLASDFVRDLLQHVKE